MASLSVLSLRRVVGSFAIIVVWVCALLGLSALRQDHLGLGSSDGAAPAPAVSAELRHATTAASASYACLADCDCSARTRVVLGGLDVMAYHLSNATGSTTHDSAGSAAAKGVPLRGSPSFTHSLSGYTFWFASAEHRDLFATNPARYAPAYGGFCAYGIAYETEPKCLEEARGCFGWDRTNLGPPVEPTKWRIYNGTLLLFMAQIAVQNFEDTTRGGPSAGVAAGDARWRAWFDLAPWARVREAAASSTAATPRGTRRNAAAPARVAYPYNTGCMCENMEDPDDAKRKCSSGR